MMKMFQDTIPNTDMEELESLMKQYKLAVETQIIYFVSKEMEKLNSFR